MKKDEETHTSDQEFSERFSLQEVEDISNLEGLPELRSESVNEIMALPPGWLLRWGITCFVFILLLVLVICNFVRYPDLIKGSFLLKADVNPKSVLARTDGLLEDIWVEDNQEVKKDEAIGLIQNSSTYDEIRELERTIDRLLQLTEDDNLDRIHQYELPRLFRLGDIQKAYQTFHNNFIRSKAYLTNGVAIRRREVLSEEEQTLNEIKQHVLDQQELLEQELEMAKQELEKSTRLFEKGYLSNSEINKAKAAYLSQLQAYEQSQSTLSNQRLSQIQKKQEIVEMDQTILEERNNLIQGLTVLKSDIETWKRKYLLLAPSDGKVVFPSVIEPNQFINNGQEVCFVQPKPIGYYGITNLGQYNFGKVEVGQQVLIKLNSYPYERFGILGGEIIEIASLPKDSLYQVKINVPLTTDMNYNIPPKTGLTGSVEIITENLSLLDRFFSEFRGLIK